MRTVRRLRLRFLLLRPGYPNPNGFHITVLSTLLLFALSKSMTGPSEVSCCSQVGNSNPQSLVKLLHITLNNTSGGPGGSRTRVQNTFLFASYSNKLYLTIFLSKSQCL